MSVHGERLAGDLRTGLRREKEDERGHVLGVDEGSERDLAEPAPWPGCA